MNARQKEQLLAGILPLIMECPYDGCNPGFCPLHDLRMLPCLERVELIMRLPEDELEYLKAYHEICLQWRGCGESEACSGETDAPAKMMG